MKRNFRTTDVLIVGGGPAGLAAAIALRQRGIAVTVADSMKPPIDKACGEGLMPDSLQELARLGVELTPADGAPFRGIRFVHGDDAGTAKFPSGLEACSGIGLRRQTLHTRLVTRAEEAGVTLRWQSPVQLLARGQVLVAGESLDPGWLVGADGQGSSVRRWAGLERGTIQSRRFGFRQHFRVEPWSQYVEVHWGKSGQAYVTPVGPNEVCVATITRDPRCRLKMMLDELPWLRAKLGSRAINWTDKSDRPDESDEPIATDTERGALTTTRRLDRVAAKLPRRGRVVLLGDASGSADAITGEGMGMAFRQALLLAECVQADDLARYNLLHPKIVQLPQTMARVMLLMDRSAIFRSRAIRMLAAQPALFERMLGVHVGSEPLAKFVATKGLELAWRLAVPVPAAPAELA